MGNLRKNFFYANRSCFLKGEKKLLDTKNDRNFENFSYTFHRKYNNIHDKKESNIELKCTQASIYKRAQRFTDLPRCHDNYRS